MAKIKISDLAYELGCEGKELLSFLQEKGVEAKRSNSSIEDADAEMARAHFKAPAAEAKKEEAPQAPKEEKPQAPKADKPAPKPADLQVLMASQLMRQRKRRRSSW